MLRGLGKRWRLPPGSRKCGKPCRARAMSNRAECWDGRS